MPILKRTDTFTKTKVNPIIATFLVIGVCLVGFSVVFSLVIFKASSLTRTNSGSVITKIFHTADVGKDYKIGQNELDYVIMLQKAGKYHCDSTAYSGYAPGDGSHNCKSHSSDYQNSDINRSGADWKISMSELLRLIQFFNMDGYRVSPTGEDGFVPLLPYHIADVNKDYKIDQNELNYVITLQKAGAYHCNGATSSGYAPGVGDHSCGPHSSDYQNGSDWKISMSELLRLTQIFNSVGYRVSPYGEDGFLPLMPYHSADVSKDYKIDQNELDYVIMLYKAGKYHCDSTAYSGYTRGAGNHSCGPHSSDYQNGSDWKISMSELLRLIQFYNTDGYKVSPTGEDGFDPISKPIEAYFKFNSPPRSETFIFKLTDPVKIQHARDIISGKITDTTHIMGKIIKEPVDYNPPWGYYLDPDSISFFQYAMEVCDAGILYVQDHLPEACGSFLPSCLWCPWGSKLISEVKL